MILCVYFYKFNFVTMLIVKKLRLSHCFLWNLVWGFCMHFHKDFVLANNPHATPQEKPMNQ